MKAIIPILKVIPLYGALGLIIGTVAALFGVGGGILMVPVCISIFERQPQVAVGTSLAAIVLISLASAIKHYTFGYVDLKLAMALAAGAIVGGVFIGAPLAHALPGDTLKRAFGYFAMTVGFYYTGVPAAVWQRLHH